MLADTLEEIERLTLIGDALVLLGRIEFGEMVAERAPVDLGSIASEAVARAQHRPSGHVFVLARSHAAMTVLADRRQVGAVLDQLLDNAVHHTPPGTRIELAVDEVDGAGEILVEDNGPGVSDEMMSHIFERFYRGDEARGRGAGPGLGLTLVAAIVKQHEGTISAERGEHGGLRFRIRLPLADAHPSRESVALGAGAA